jgi:hypothetical protein
MTAYVQIVVPDRWSPEQFKNWFECVNDSVPSGLISSTSIQLKGKVKATKFFHKPTSNGKHAYIVPLARDLDASEIHTLIRNWVRCYPEGDFTLDYSQAEDIIQPQTPEQLKLDQVIDAWCKQEHQAWMESQLEQGWRYGPQINLREKTHPWMQPWESLPQRAQKRNLASVERLMEILDEFGYAIVQKPEA